MERNRIIILLVGVLAIVSCVKLDSFMFNAEPADEYLFEAYQGERELSLPDSFGIADSMIHQFSYPVEDENVQAVYIGELWEIGLSDTVIVYCHGNAANMEKYWNRAKLLAHIGGKHRYGVLMMDYRGYGASDGTASEQRLNQDVAGALNWLGDWGLQSDRLVIYGYSLGTGPASAMAVANGELVPNKVILECPFASTDVMANDAAGITVPISYVSTYDFDVAGRAKEMKQPLLWLHGVEDAFLSMASHGEVVFGNHPGPKTAVRVASAGHTDVPEIMGFDPYLTVLLDFITD